MDRKGIEKRIRQWEAEGYDVSELKQKWFPKGAGGRSRTWIVLSVVVVASVVVIALSMWQTAPPRYQDIGEIKILGNAFLIGSEPVPVMQVRIFEPALGFSTTVGDIKLTPGNWVFEAEPGPVTKVWAREPELGLTVEIGEFQLLPGTYMVYAEMQPNLDDEQ